MRAMGRGITPVVKSYPHASQNSASTTLRVSQLGHRWVVGASGDESPAGVCGDAAGTTGGGEATCGATIGLPQMSQ